MPTEILYMIQNAVKYILIFNSIFFSILHIKVAFNYSSYKSITHNENILQN